jgi:hypothetical protein
MEHIHTLPQPWDLEDEFRRISTWNSLGVDDTVDVSVPWARNPEVSWKDTVLPAGKGCQYSVLVREYNTPAGTIRHSVKKTEEDPGEGWVVQPNCVPLFEDYNIPRGVEHAVGCVDDVQKVGFLYTSPGEIEKDWFKKRMQEVDTFCRENGIAVQAWSAFGIDAVVWLCGVEGAIFMAMDKSATFRQLVEMIAETDYERTMLACEHPAVDIIIQRGWYGGTDFWSPKLFDEFQLPYINEIVDFIHKKGKKYGFVFTTGVEVLGKKLVDAGVDVIYFVDPVQDHLSVEKARSMFGGDVTLVGGTNSLSLASRDEKIIGEQVKRAIDALGPTRRFILHPVDALHPDTPWEGVEILIEKWKACQ